MKPHISILIILFTSLVIMNGCKKSHNSSSGGGKGGNATLLITPEHHGQFVDTCEIYIKYGTQNAPANGIYDDSAACVLNDTTPIATFTNLTTGSYYIYGIGYHALYTPPNIKGGLPVTISTEDTNTVYLPTYTYYP